MTVKEKEVLEAQGATLRDRLEWRKLPRSTRKEILADIEREEQENKKARDNRVLAIALAVATVLILLFGRLPL